MDFMKVPFLPMPRKIALNGKKCILKGAVEVLSNTEPTVSFSYLLGLAGFECERVKHVKRQPDEPLYLVIGAKPEMLIIPEYRDEEAYAMESSEKSIIITAHTVQGLAHGVKLLVRLHKSGMLDNGYWVQDRPDVHLRGIHMCIFNPDDGTEKDITDINNIRRRVIVAALSGYNHVFLEFWGMFPYRRSELTRLAHWPKAWTWDEVTGLIDFMIDDLHITPCPTQNLTSHAGWSRLVSRKHVMLDQYPQHDDLYIQGGWCFTTENPKTQQFLRDIIDDLSEAYRKPPFIHCSCDKCFGFGSSEEDRTKPADILFAKHLCFLNDTISAKGSRMVMWSDTLYSSMDCLLWKCDPHTARMLPKNILMNIWTHNDPGAYWNDVEFFENLGFQSVYSPFFNRAGARSMVKICKQHNSLGLIQTTWHRPELSLPTVVFSGGAQWGDCQEADCDELLERCLALYQE